MKQQIFKKLFLALLLITYSVSGQTKTITGTVLDETGGPLPGASIIIKGSSNGNTTDFDGKFKMNAKPTDILVFTYMGYDTKEILIGSQTTISVRLLPNSQMLDEIIVVGFGSEKKSSISGSVTNVKLGKIIGDRPITDASSALQGVAAGLQVTTSSGQPGVNSTSLELRGFGNINQATPPLILLDNVEVSLSDINPNDIESVSILKDAAAASIYGAKGAWGVILMTTKKPTRDQKVRFNYRSTISFSKAQQLPEKGTVRDFVNLLQDVGVNRYFTNQSVETWSNYLDDYAVNPGNYPNGRVLDADGYIYSLREENPIQQLLGSNGVIKRHDFDFSGGSQKTSYRVSTSYSDEDGIIVTDNDSYKKYNVNAFLNTDLTKNLKSTTNIFYRKSERSNPIGSYDRAVNEPVYIPTGYFTLDDGRELPFNSPDNLERLLPHTIVNTDVLRMFQKLEFEPIKDLKFSGEFTYERGTTKSVSQNIQLLTVDAAQFGVNNNNPDLTSVSKSFSEFEDTTLNFFVDYKFSISENHNIKLKAGINNEESFFNGFNVRRLNLLSTDVPFIDAAIGTTEGGDFFSETAVLGYFGNVKYNYKQKYFLEGNIRYDGSSKFPISDRYGLFTSASAAWNLKKESFLENIEWLSLLKIFGSYGEIGNQDIPQNYPYISTWSPRETWFLNESGIRATTIQSGALVSPSLTWETVRKTNLGIETAFLKKKLTSKIEVYKNETIGMLIPGAALPGVLGTGAPRTNAGDLETTGWELSLGWRDNKDGFSYGVNANISNNKTEITKFDNPAGLLGQYYVGREIGEIWGYETDGYYTVDDFVPGTLDANLNGANRQLNSGIATFEDNHLPYPGDVKYKDLDGDGVITDGNNTLENPGDVKIIGNSRRQYIFGINGYASYKNFDFSFALSGVGKRDRNITGSKGFPYRSQFDDVFKHQLDYWTPENQDAFYPRMFGAGAGDRGNYGSNQRVQTKYLRDASYLKINNITLGYTLPKQVLDRIHLDKVRLFLSGENLHTFHKLPKGITPDVNSDGTYPIQSNFALGVQLTL
jgi:TonB-linked SusC/RagA family outer membrane protein